MVKSKLLKIGLTGAILLGGTSIVFANTINNEIIPQRNIIPISTLINGDSLPSFTETRFTDIQKHWAYNEITSLEAKGMWGDLSGNFEPNKTINGEEFASYLTKIFNFKADSNFEFDNELEVTRIEVAKAIKESFEKKKLSVIMTQMFPLYEDTKDLTQEEISALSFVFNTGIMKGRTDQKFFPNDAITKAELAVVLDRTQAIYDKVSVESLVEDFGRKLQAVSLQAPVDIVSKSMEENYGDFVSPELLAKWQNNPQNAPGRILSSPWPDRIEILSLDKLSGDAYEVKGEIIEITSTEKVRGGVAAKLPITLEVKNIDNRWIIDDVTLGVYQETDSIVYRNSQYGFNFSLPENWEGYSIITDNWEGSDLEAPQEGRTVETGPIISIRHPKWTAQNQRQDIPIMIFTVNQWEALQQNEFSVGAAPIGPRELGRNTEYVFAIPARYNYAFPTGYEEVENILESNPLQTK
ncbi:S-layer homology domain-containing protein [Desulfolucanica intricata]|uniref:S-layer homology domain-containing protein n=1 Tax=Desulfolucanica intricata TaxID=1285191 RepID=UPI0009EF5C3E|nr:S-layer homology domain-containing protein [Desulfolucanica intricata]